MNELLEQLANESCCGTSSFVKRAAEAALTIPTEEGKHDFIEYLSTGPDTQISAPWRNKCLEALIAYDNTQGDTNV